MARRYNRILQAAKYYAAIDNYIKYIQDASRRGSRVGTGTPRPASKILYVKPFNIALGNTTVAVVSGAQPTWTARQAIFALHTKDTIPDTVQGVKVKGFKAARVIITTGRSTTGVKKTSRVTGMPYLDYGGKSTSLPFGRNTQTETEAEAFETIKTDLLQAIAGALVTLQPEQI
jgi:hypothetical protein